MMTERSTTLRARVSASYSGSYDLWGDLSRRIRKGEVVPILSNAVVNNRIFDVGGDGCIGIAGGTADDEGHQLAIDERIAKAWAAFIGYPLAESPLLLCRVAQYNQIQVGYTETAKIHYLDFLKLYLLDLAGSDPNVAHLAQSYLENIATDANVSEIVDQLSDVSFAELAFQLGYPRYEAKSSDPLYLLAQLPLPIYATTSHHDFLERALADAGKHPRIQVCACFGDAYSQRPEIEWFGLPPTSGEDLDAEATEVAPIVYHLYGIEKYPATLVISEDDYIEFLVTISANRDALPLRLRRALAQSSMLLLGYRLPSWEFRVLFQGIIKRVLETTKTPDKPNLAIQLHPPAEWKPDSEEMEQYLKEAKGYLEKLFQPEFMVEWDSTAGFAQRLLERWREGTR